MSENVPLVAVTGAGGFLGSHLVEELLGAGHRVRALVHYNALGRAGHLDAVRAALKKDAAARLEVVAGDVCDARCVRTLVEGCTAVYHLAALIGIPYSYIAPHSYIRTNVEGTLNVLEACRDAAIPRVLHTSTSEVYGTAVTTPMSEQHPLKAQSPYSASKIAADKIAESYFLSFDLPVVTVRPFNAFGPRQSLRAVIPTIIAQALDKKQTAIRLGSLSPVRDFTYAADTARAFRLLGEAPIEKVAGNVYNAASGQGISIASLAKLILQALKIEKPVEEETERVRPSASEVQILIGDSARLRRDTGWKSEVNLEEGLARTAEYLRSHKEELRAGVYTR